MLLRKHRILQTGNFIPYRCRENHVIAKAILTYRYNRTQLISEIAQKRAALLPELVDVHLQGERDDAFSQLRQLRFFFTIQTIPVAFNRVARQIATAVRVILFAEFFVLWIARQLFLLAVATIEEALRVVALLIAVAIVEYLPAADCRRAVAPWIDAQRAIAAVKVARVRIAGLVAFPIPFLLVATIFLALLSLSL